MTHSRSMMASSEAIKCSSGSDVRTIENRPTSEGGCEVVYTKSTGSKVVANARSDLSYCNRTIDKISGNLKKAGFQCK